MQERRRLEERHETIDLILYFLKSHNTSCLPPKIVHGHCFRFPLGHLYVLREIENNDWAKFWGYTRCIMGFEKVKNEKKAYVCSTFWFIFQPFSSGQRRV